MSHFTLLHLPHRTLNEFFPSYTSSSHHADAATRGRTADLAICAIIDDASTSAIPVDPVGTEYADDDAGHIGSREDIVRLQHRLDALIGEAEHARGEQAMRIRQLDEDMLDRDARIRELEAANTRLEATSVDLAASRDRLSEVVDELSSTRNDLEGTVEELQRRIDKLEPLHTALQTLNTAHRDRIRSLEAEVTRLRTENNTRDKELEDAVKMHRELTATKEGLNTQVRHLTASHGERERRIIALQKQLADAAAAAAEKEEEQKVRQRELSRSHAAQTAETRNLRLELTKLASSLQATTSENAGLANAVEQLESAMANLKLEATALKAELADAKSEGAQWQTVCRGMEPTLASRARRIADMEAETDRLTRDLSILRVATEAADAQVNDLRTERHVAHCHLASARAEIDALREPSLASDADIAGMLGELNDAIRKVANDVAAHVQSSSSTIGEASTADSKARVARLRTWLGESVCGDLLRGDLATRHAVLPHALRATVAHWVGGIVGRWSLTDVEENRTLRRLYGLIAQRYDGQVAGRWRAMTVRVNARADDAIYAALETPLLDSLATVLTVARFEQVPRDDAESLDVLVESLVWKALELREHVGVVVTDRELALALPRPGDAFDGDSMQIAATNPPSASHQNGVCALEAEEGTDGRAAQGGVEDLVPKVSCGVALGLVRYEGTTPLSIVKSQVLPFWSANLVRAR
ncbi:hypothetical protein HDZ31DRAFT_41749 [Schizophyllum fasciatum]